LSIVDRLEKKRRVEREEGKKQGVGERERER